MNELNDTQKEALRDVSWHIIVAAERAIIESVANKLGDIAGAFHVTGNWTMGNTLDELTIDLEDASVMIAAAVGKSQKEQLRRSQEASVNMINATLAVSQHKGE